MIAAGLIFFAIKRRSRYARNSQMAQWMMYRAIEALNITAITGIIIACIAYLWANRLLPFDIKERADAEITAFFSVWLIMLLHSFLRPPLRAWIEQLRIAAVLCIGLPVLNALTTNVGLLQSIARNDWMTAGVDLTAASLGIILAFTAWRISLKEKNSEKRYEYYRQNENPFNKT
jgi:hypothetical protein